MKMKSIRSRNFPVYRTQMTLWVYPPEKKLRKELTFHQGIFYIFTDFVYIFYQPLREEYKVSVIVNLPICLFCSICSSYLLRLCWQVLTKVGLLYLGEITFIICDILVSFWLFFLMLTLLYSFLVVSVCIGLSFFYKDFIFIFGFQQFLMYPAVSFFFFNC